MSRTILAFAFLLACISQLRAEEVDSQELALNTHRVWIEEVALQDEIAADLEDIAVNSDRYVNEGKGEILQALQLTAVDGLRTRYVLTDDKFLRRSGAKSGRSNAEEVFSASVRYWMGFLVTLDTTSNQEGVKLKLNYEHCFVPGLSPDSEESEVITFTADDQINLGGGTAVAIEAKGINQRSRSWGKRVYLIVRLAPTTDDARQSAEE